MNGAMPVCRAIMYKITAKPIGKIILIFPHIIFNFNFFSTYFICVLLHEKIEIKMDMVNSYYLVQYLNYLFHG